MLDRPSDSRWKTYPPVVTVGPLISPPAAQLVLTTSCLGWLQRTDEKLTRLRARKAANSQRYRQRRKGCIVVLRITARLDHAVSLLRLKGRLPVGVEPTVEEVEQSLTDWIDNEGA